MEPYGTVFALATFVYFKMCNFLFGMLIYFQPMTAEMMMKKIAGESGDGGDPSNKTFMQFINQLVPSITRVVKFCKGLLGTFHIHSFLHIYGDM